MANKLYSVNACGHFEKGQVFGMCVIAPDALSAREVVRNRFSHLVSKILFVEEINMEEYPNFVFNVNSAFADCYKLPSGENVGAFEIVCDFDF